MPSSPLRDSAPFKNALALAKGIARQLKVPALGIEHLAAGFALLLLRGEGELPEWLTENREHFIRALDRFALERESVESVAAEEKMPLEPGLRQLVRDNDGSLDDLGGHLAAWLDATLSQTPETQRIWRRASVVARAKDAVAVDAEAFCVGAYALYLHGELTDWPVLAALMANNAEAIGELVRQAELATPATDDETLLPLADDVRSSFAQGAKKSPSYLRALNIGLKSADSLLARQRIAYHEAGHAVASYVLRPALTVTHVTVVPDDDSLGAAWFDGDSPFWDRLSAQDASAALVVALAGRTAQQIRYGTDQADSGAMSDIDNATARAWNAVARFGLDEEFGCVSLPRLGKLTGTEGGALFDEAQRRVQHLLKEAGLRCRCLLEENWALVEVVSEALLSQDSLSSEDLLARVLLTRLEALPGVVEATSLPVERAVSFAAEPGVTLTAEGPVRHAQGDAIVSDDTGPPWPVARQVFEQTYAPTAGVTPGSPGRYCKRPRKVLALRLRDQRRVDLSGGRGLLTGEAGDWVVDYGNGDLAIVRAEVFAATYEFDEPGVDAISG